MADHMRKVSKAWMVGVSLACAWSGSAAADTSTTGKISRILVVAGPGGAPSNADSRFFLTGNPSLCSGATDPTWVYINISDPNYKPVVAILSAAYISGKTVQIVASATNISSGWYCQLSYAVVQD